MTITVTHKFKNLVHWILTWMSFKLGFAPASNSFLTITTLPLRVAAISTVHSYSSSTIAHIEQINTCIRSRKIERCTAAVKKIIGMKFFPELTLRCFEFGSAPASKSVATISTFPASAALVRAVQSFTSTHMPKRLEKDRTLSENTENMSFWTHIPFLECHDDHHSKVLFTHIVMLSIGICPCPQQFLHDLQRLPKSCSCQRSLSLHE